jgi:hypothetical protein
VQQEAKPERTGILEEFAHLISAFNLRLAVILTFYLAKPYRQNFTIRQHFNHISALNWTHNESKRYGGTIMIRRILRRMLRRQVRRQERRVARRILRRRRF